MFWWVGFRELSHVFVIILMVTCALHIALGCCFRGCLFWFVYGGFLLDSCCVGLVLRVCELYDSSGVSASGWTGFVGFGGGCL